MGSNKALTQPCGTRLVARCTARYQWRTASPLRRSPRHGQLAAVVALSHRDAAQLAPLRCKRQRLSSGNAAHGVLLSLRKLWTILREHSSGQRRCSGSQQAIAWQADALQPANMRRATNLGFDSPCVNAHVHRCTRHGESRPCSPPPLATALYRQLAACARECPCIVPLQRTAHAVAALLRAPSLVDGKAVTTAKAHTAA